MSTETRWRQEGGRLIHSSGIVVEYDEEFGGWTTTEDSTEAWSRAQTALGVSLEDQQDILLNLCHEAAEWSADNS